MYEMFINVFGTILWYFMLTVTFIVIPVSMVLLYLEDR